MPKVASWKMFLAFMFCKFMVFKYKLYSFGGTAVSRMLSVMVDLVK